MLTLKYNRIGGKSSQYTFWQEQDKYVSSRHSGHCYPNDQVGCLGVETDSSETRLSEKVPEGGSTPVQRLRRVTSGGVQPQYDFLEAGGGKAYSSGVERPQVESSYRP